MKINHLELSPQKKAVIMKSLLWNIIVDIFQEKKGIDIGPFIISISMKETTFFVSYSKPILKAETILYENNIFNTFAQKLDKMGITSEKIKIRYK